MYICIIEIRNIKHKAMTNNDFDRYTDEIWRQLNSIENQDISHEDKKQLIKSVLIKLSDESVKLGRRQVKNYFQNSINDLK